MKLLSHISIFLIISLTSFNLFSYEVKNGVLRTPDERFQNLKDYPYEPNYMMIDGLRIHYLDEGPKDADPIFLLHGEPAWSYLFRKMIPTLTAQGHRVIVPDCVGFGKSDKFISKYDYSYKHHVEVMKELVQKLNLKNVTFFGQDWGGLVGLRVVAELPDRFSHVVVSNTGMVARSGLTAWLFEKFIQLRVWWIGPISFDELMEAAAEALNGNPSTSAGISMFTKWMAYSYYAEDMDIVGIIRNFGNIDLSEEEAYAYEAPYPSGLYKAGAHVWPYLIPTQLTENEQLWKDVYEKWDKPFLVAFGEKERITLPMKDDFLNRIPNPTVITLGGASHFVQEEVGPELAQIISDFINGKPVKDLPAKL
jgi:haloalkane dehalogenase|tara:strand:- start:1985 stop:3079 length:1095 start_codon:yes stop_codon:yes gene_type:complete